jgi:methionyl-tRNA formyltransferase
VTAQPPRLVLVSSHVFGLRAFEGIFASPAFLTGQIEVALMVGLDPAHAPAGWDYRPLDTLAAEHGAPYLATSDGRLTSLSARIAEAAPAYLLVVGWARLIPAEILALPAPPSARAAGEGTHGCIGMHPTRLPDGRGRAAIPWTIIKGRDITALSVFFLEPGADTGPVIAQYELPVHPRETAASLSYRVANAHFTAGFDLAGQMAAGQVRGRPQRDADATTWPRRRPADGEIRPEMTRREVDALVRALLGPYPRAFVRTASGNVPIRAAVASPGPRDEPRPFRDDLIEFRCQDGIVFLRPDRNAQA